MGQLGRGSREGEKTNSKLCIELVTALGQLRFSPGVLGRTPCGCLPKMGQREVFTHRLQYFIFFAIRANAFFLLNLLNLLFINILFILFLLFIFLYLNYLHKQNGWQVSLQRLWCTDPVGAMKARTKRMGGEEVRQSVSYMTSLCCKDIWEMQFLLMVATSPAKTNSFCFCFGYC